MSGETPKGPSTASLGEATGDGHLGPAVVPPTTAVSKEWDPDTLFDVFGSESARNILALASVESMSAHELADHLDISEPTVYRRLNVLQNYDLVAEDTRIDDDGNHYKTYETNLERVAFEIDEGEFVVDVRLKRDLVDQFERFWEDLGGDGGDG